VTSARLFAPDVARKPVENVTRYIVVVVVIIIVVVVVVVVILQGIGHSRPVPVQNF
jgi:hypothetical protein